MFRPELPRRTSADSSASTKFETSAKECSVMWWGRPSLFLSMFQRRLSWGSALSKTVPKMLSIAR